MNQDSYLDKYTLNMFFGTNMHELRRFSLITAATGMVHPLYYVWCYFLPMNKIVIGIWVLVGLYFLASTLLLIGLMERVHVLLTIYIWFSWVCVPLLVVMLLVLLVTQAPRRQWFVIMVIILGISWYFVAIYLTLVVNTYRQWMAPKNWPSYRPYYKRMFEDFFN